ncbi:MAG: preprotein translocase subunit SecE [Planctomycetes bacterium]|nr:preprotein translocase subunit SecE [Planctomycetota bacterium]
MAVGIYKKGQGYWTRLMSAIALGMLVLMGAVWLWQLLEQLRIGTVQQVYVQATGSVILLAVAGWLGYWLIGCKPRVVDFMIATEGEMKKVNWSSRREILGSTWVVIGLTVFIAIFCFCFDRVFQQIFTWVDVLESTGG